MPLLRAPAVLALLLAAGCTFDFDAPFAEQSGGGAPAGSTGSDAGPTTGPGGGEGASSSTASTASAGGGGQGGAAPTEEDCQNGVDDDDDGAVDCADAACEEAGFRCAAPAPEGFSGPVALARDGASCGGAFPRLELDGGIGLDADPASCAACSCGAPEGEACSAELTWYVSPDCTMEQGAITIGGTGCDDVADTALFAVIAAAPTPSGGTCAPSGGQQTSPPAAFAEPVRLCGVDPGAGCGAEVCLGPPGSPLEDTLCVYRSGAGTCDEAGPFTAQLDVHEARADTRACSRCDCGPPTGGSCTGTSAISQSNNNCTGQGITLDHDGACTQVSEVMRSIEPDFALSGGACLAVGGEESGAVSLEGPVTVCCLP